MRAKLVMEDVSGCGRAGLNCGVEGRPEWQNQALYERARRTMTLTRESVENDVVCSCGGPGRLAQRVGRTRPSEYYVCERCGRFWLVDEELLAHRRRVSDEPPRTK